MPASAQPDAIEILLADHRRVHKLFKEFDKLKRGEDLEAFVEVVESACAELQLHGMLELEIFYPAVRSQSDEAMEELLNEADVEHETVEALIYKLADLEPDDPMYAANFTVLREYVEHHVKEEEKELFPKVRKLKNLDLRELGIEMQARKDALLSELGEAEEEIDDEADEDEDYDDAALETIGKEDTTDDRARR
jgi:hemerythrin superfamily protein